MNEFAEAVTDLIAQNIEDRTERMRAVEALMDAYIDSVGKRPDQAQLERLADYILREELTDNNPHKSAHNEYPILSEIQLNRRRHGRRGSEDTNMNGETPLLTEDGDDTNDNHARSGVYLASDGRDYRRPVRRTRSITELIFVDECAKIRNKARAAQYKRDTAAGPVHSYNLRDTGGEFTAEFVKCRDHGVNVIPEYYRTTRQSGSRRSNSAGVTLK